jgi:uroporphyrin-III C-methyltransferase
MSAPYPVSASAASRDPALRWALALAIALAIAAGALAWDARQTAGSITQSAGSRLGELGADLAVAKAALAQAQAALKESQSRIAELEARVVETQESRTAIEEMARELNRSADDRMLAEVEQLLILASQQLQLGANVKGALVAMQAADARLARTEKVPSAGLRRVLNQDMERLKALPQVDTVGIAVKLDALVQQADTLPLVVPETLPAARVAARARTLEEPGLTRAARDFWDEMKGLVRIRELEAGDSALLAPAQTYFLRENLKLRLLAARVALLARDEGSFREDVKAAQAWVAKYFDSKARANMNAAATLKGLAESPVSIAVPDINASIAAVRSARATREKSR